MTGQSIYTMEVFRPLRNLWNQAREWTKASITASGLTWMSKYIYRYPILMLQNLSSRSPSTLHWPLYSYPPPHFLIGYQYVVKTMNDYVFDTRAYTTVKYHEVTYPMHQIMNWSMMCTCVYTVNTSAYHRFIDLDNFAESLGQIQQSILQDRIAADLASIQQLRGEGQPVFVDEYKNLSLCQDRIWGLADRTRFKTIGHKDLIILKTIRKLKTAYFNYLLSSTSDQLNLPCDCDWIDAFLKHFEQRPLEDRCTQEITKSIINALILPQPAVTSLSGGAFVLRPRENGRAVTEEMRRRRGEMIERFVDRLPIRRRQRRRRPVLSPPSPEQDIETDFETEVRNAIAGVIQMLEEELTDAARNQEFFNFAVDFYQAMNRLETMAMINELTLRRWVVYFFVVEHIATTLNYLHQHLISNSLFSRHVELHLGQVVLRARNDEGQLIYSRVWTENGINSFSNLIRRISTDLASNIEYAGSENAEEDLEQFMINSAFHENSGDVNEIIKQMELNDADIDSMELSFRFKLTGPVAFTQNPEIREINKQVIQTATNLRRNNQTLPALNEEIDLVAQ